MKKITSVFLSVCLCLVLCAVLVGCAGANDDSGTPDAYSSNISIENGNLVADFDGTSINFGKLDDLLYQFEELSDGSYAVRLDATMLAEGLTMEQDGVTYQLDNEATKELITELNFPETYNGKPITKINQEYNPYGSAGSSQFVNVTKVTIPKTVTVIGSRAFDGFTALTDFALHEGITTLEQNALANCSSLPAITLPSTLHTLEDGALSGCASLTSLVIPDTVEYLGGWIVSDCKSLSYLKMRLPEECFNGAANWFSSSFAGGIEAELTLELTGGSTLYTSTLKGSEALTKLIIHQMDKIESIAIYELPNLREIEFGENVSELEDTVVSACPKLEKVTFRSTPRLHSNVFGLSSGYSQDFRIEFDGTLEELKAWVTNQGTQWYVLDGFIINCSDGTIDMNDFYR